MESTPDRMSRNHAPSLFWPIILIGAGVIFLLSNLGMLAVEPWWLIWRLWPVLLIVIGLDILFGRHGILGAVVSLTLGLVVIGGVITLLIAAPANPEWLQPPFNLTTSQTLLTKHIAHPLNQVHSADLQIDLHGGSATVQAVDDSSNLIQGDVSYYGNLVDTATVTNDRAVIRLANDDSIMSWFARRPGQPAWQVDLNSNVEYDARFLMGSGRYQLDLNKLNLKSLAIDVGSGSVALSLPNGSYRADLHLSSGNATIRLPSDTATRVEYHVDSGSVNARGLTQTGRDRHSGVYETAGLASASRSVTLVLDVNSGNITIQQ